MKKELRSFGPDHYRTRAGEKGFEKNCDGAAVGLPDADRDPANRPSYPRELPWDVMTARGDVKGEKGWSANLKYRNTKDAARTYVTFGAAAFGAIALSPTVKSLLKKLK
jgi:hypothetical protein